MTREPPPLTIRVTRTEGLAVAEEWWWQLLGTRDGGFSGGRGVMVVIRVMEGLAVAEGWWWQENTHAARDSSDRGRGCRQGGGWHQSCV